MKRLREQQTDLAFFDGNVARLALFHHFEHHVALNLVEELREKLRTRISHERPP